MYNSKKNIVLLSFILIVLSFKIFSQENIRVNVNSNPSGATWHISGSNDTSTTPTSAKFRKGQIYNIVFTKQGYESITYSYRGGSGDIYIKLYPKQQHNQKPRDEKKHKPDNDRKINTGKIYINSNPQGAAFVIAGDPKVLFTPVSMKFVKNRKYHITFTKPGFLPKTIIYRGGTGNINVVLQTAHLKRPPRL